MSGCSRTPLATASFPHPPKGYPAITITTTPGSTVPIRNPFEVMPEMADVPRRVTSVAHQYIAIENNPTYSPFCASAGTPIM